MSFNIHTFCLSMRVSQHLYVSSNEDTPTTVDVLAFPILSKGYKQRKADLQGPLCVLEPASTECNQTGNLRCTFSTGALSVIRRIISTNSRVIAEKTCFYTCVNRETNSCTYTIGNEDLSPRLLQEWVVFSWLLSLCRNGHNQVPTAFQAAFFFSSKLQKFCRNML